MAILGELIRSFDHSVRMPRFRDENTLEDIQGCYLVASSWPDFHPEFDIQDQLAEFVERIQDKLTRNRNKIRHNWFTIALEHAKQAQQHYGDGQVERDRQSLRLAWEHLESGNKASRRHTTFIARSDGGIEQV